MNLRPRPFRLSPECDQTMLAELVSSLHRDFLNGRVSGKLFAHRSRVIRQQGARLQLESLEAAAVPQRGGSTARQPSVPTL